jgi:peptide/nickel transport system substrate-binding protein
MRYRFLAVFSVFVTIAAACSPAPSTPQSAGQPAPPTGTTKSANQTVTIAKIGLPGTASPESSSSNNEIFQNIYDPLLAFGPNFQILPAVAQKWEFNAQQNSWRFTLRQDMTFSNGDKLTADDVVFSIGLAVDKNMPTKAFFPAVTGAKKVDDYTVDIISKTPDVTVLNGGPWMYIFPSKYYQQVGTAQFGVKPIGSGPYVLTDFKSSDSMVFQLRPTPHPYRKPNFTQITFKAIPELSQEIAGVRTGDLDVVSQTAFTPDQIDQLKTAGMTILTLQVGNVTALYSQPEAVARNSPLQDKTVRLALNYAVNKDAINSLFKGLATPAGQLGEPGSPFWDDSVKPYPYNVAMAKQLLAQAGYPNGFKLPVGIGYTPQTADPNMVLALQSDLQAVGVEAAVNSYEFATFLDQYYGRNGAQKGDLFVQSLGDSNGSFSQGRGLYDCNKQGFAIWWCNQDFNRLYDQAITEPDAAKRADLMRQANAALRSDIPNLYMVLTSQFVVLNPKIKGFTWPTVAFNFDNAYKVE